MSENRILFKKIYFPKAKAWKRTCESFRAVGADLGGFGFCIIPTVSEHFLSSPSVANTEVLVTWRAVGCSELPKAYSLITVIRSGSNFVLEQNLLPRQLKVRDQVSLKKQTKQLRTHTQVPVSWHFLWANVVEMGKSWCVFDSFVGWPHVSIYMK